MLINKMKQRGTVKKTKKHKKSYIPGNGILYIILNIYVNKYLHIYVDTWC